MVIKKLCAVLAATLLVGIAGCSTSSSTDKPAEVATVIELYNELPEKYKVPDLEPVDRLIDFNINGWETIDDRSLIIQASVSKRYLIVLRTRSPDLRFAQAVAIDHRGDSYIRPGFDRVYVGGDQNRMPYYIQAIYILDGREGAKAAKNYIRDYDKNHQEEK